MGRPKSKDEKKRKNICRVRLTDTETMHLLVLRQRAKKNTSDLIRDSLEYYADKKYGIPSFGSTENEYWKHLVKHVLDE